MKSLKNIIFIGILLLNSCFSDDSKNFTLINPIIIDATGISESFTIQRYDTISITPLVYKKGVSDENLSFNWQIIGGGITRNLGDKLKLNAEITEIVMADSYKLLLTVTDNSTGIAEYMEWPVTIRANIGSGLIVADTRDDGITSDLSLVMSYDFTNSQKETKIYYNLFSNSNHGRKINGTVNNIQTYNIMGQIGMTVLSSKSILDLDPLNYICSGQDNDLFYVKFKDNETIESTTIGFNYGRSLEYASVNGNIFTRSLSNPRVPYNFQTTLAFPSASGTTNYRITKFCAYYSNKTTHTIGYGFEESKGSFVALGASFSSLQYLSSGMGVFDLNNISNSKCQYIGMGYVGGTARPVYSILKDTVTNRNYFYHLEQFINFNEANYNSKIAIAKYDLNTLNCPEINSAIFFSSNMTDNSFFYATDSKVYSMLISSGIKINQSPQYICKSGEVITEMKLWTSSSVGAIAVNGVVKDVGGDVKFASRGRLLLVCTYNENTKEGKVIAIPLITTNSGLLDSDESSHRVFSGFGKIVNISPQII